MTQHRNIKEAMFLRTPDKALDKVNLNHQMSLL